MPFVPLAQLSIPPDLIGPLIFGIIFVGSWIWGGYKKVVKRREAQLAKEASYGGRAAPVEDRRSEATRDGGRGDAGRASSGRGPVVASAAPSGGGMSMRDRIERARAEAAAGGRPSRPSGSGNTTTRPSPRPPVPRRPAPQPQRPLPDFVVREQPARQAPARRPVQTAPRPRPVAQAKPKPKPQTLSVAEPIAEPTIVVHAPVSRDDLRHAVVMAELLRPPVALREPDER